MSMATWGRQVAEAATESDAEEITKKELPLLSQLVYLFGNRKRKWICFAFLSLIAFAPELLPFVKLGGYLPLSHWVFGFLLSPPT